jgi:CHAD domain-containing protein
MLRSPGPAYDLRATMSQELHTAIDELSAANDSPRALHRCRVCLKRARALARVGRVSAPGLSAVFNDTARGMMRMLGLARDATVLSETARAMAQSARGKTAAALESIAANLEAEAAAQAPLNLETARAGLKDLLALAMVWPEASPRQIRRGAQRLQRRARRARLHGLGARCPERRHQWRKRSKDRYYAALLLGPAWPALRKRKLSEKLGHALGLERDALMLIERLKAAPGLAGEGGATKRALKAIRRRRKRLARRADALGARMSVAGA